MKGWVDLQRTVYPYINGNPSTGGPGKFARGSTPVRDDVLPLSHQTKQYYMRVFQLSNKCMSWCCSGLNWQSRGRRFDSRSLHFHVTTQCKLSTHMCLVMGSLEALPPLKASRSSIFTVLVLRVTVLVLTITVSVLILPLLPWSCASRPKQFKIRMTDKTRHSWLTLRWWERVEGAVVKVRGKEGWAPRSPAALVWAHCC